MWLVEMLILFRVLFPYRCNRCEYLTIVGREWLLYEGEGPYTEVGSLPYPQPTVLGRGRGNGVENGTLKVRSASKGTAGALLLDTSCVSTRRGEGWRNG